MIFKSLKKIIKKKLLEILVYGDKQDQYKIYEALSSVYFSEKYERFRKVYDIHESFVFNGQFILFHGKGKIQCGNNSYISDYSTVQAHEDCTIKIGSGCSISSNVRIFTSSAVSTQDFSKKEKEKYCGDVIIHDYVWIGANVLINPGITIGKNSVVGANSVVTKDIPENSICGGVPAKLIKLKKI